MTFCVLLVKFEVEMLRDLLVYKQLICGGKKLYYLGYKLRLVVKPNKGHKTFAKILNPKQFKLLFMLFFYNSRFQYKHKQYFKFVSCHLNILVDIYF